MAPRETSYTQFKKIAADIRAGKIAPVYLLTGEEAYFIDTLTDLLQERIIDPDSRDFDQTIIYGADASLEGVMSIVRQFPIMSDRRLVILKEAQAMDDFKRRLEKMAPYFERPMQSTVFVIAHKGEAVKSTSTAAKAILKGGGVYYCSSELYDNQVPPVIKEYCNSRHISIDDSAIAMIIELTGVSISGIVSVIDKIIMAEGKGLSRITAEEISVHSGVNKDYNSRELADAVASKNFPKAMKIVTYLERNPKSSATPINARVLFQLFAQILICHYAKDKSPKGIAAAIGARSEYALQVRAVQSGMRNYSASSCVRIIHAIRSFDGMSKGVGSLQKDTSLQVELIYKIFTL